MKKNYRTAAALVVIFSAATLLFSCIKEAGNGINYLKVSHGVVNVSTTGSRTQFSVESDLKWKLELSPDDAKWLELSTNKGDGNKTVTITATQPPLPNGAVRNVDVIATAVNNSSVPSVRLMVLQHDTTYVK